MLWTKQLHEYRVWLIAPWECACVYIKFYFSIMQARHPLSCRLMTQVFLNEKVWNCKAVWSDRLKLRVFFFIKNAFELNKSPVVAWLPSLADMLFQGIRSTNVGCYSSVRCQDSLCSILLSFHPPWLTTTLYLQRYDSFGNAGLAQEGIVLE